jgi:mRNA interferase RelE/StbE
LRFDTIGRVRIEITRKAIRSVDRIPEPERSRIRAKIRQYARDPASLANRVTRLKATRSYRLRVGDYRVIFDLAGGAMVVLDIGHRREIYD